MASYSVNEEGIAYARKRLAERLGEFERERETELREHRRKDSNLQSSP